MSNLSIACLGPFQARLGDQPIPDFQTRKVQALLIFLTAEPEKHPREILMELMWPGMPDRSARHNLRQVLYYLRGAMPDLDSNQEGEEDKVPFLLTNRQNIQLNPEAQVKVDVAQFQALLDRVQVHEHMSLLTCPDCLRRLGEAIDLYRGDFLADFYLDDSNVFEEWAQVSREAYRRKVLDALEVLTTAATRQQEYPKAEALARRQSEIDNLRESAYRQLMEILARSGRREEALTVYENCRRLLAEELSMEPARRTTELAKKITAGDLSLDVSPVPGVRGYELKEEVGTGSYGAIHRAYQPAVDREVAVKVIRRKYANDPEFIRRFETEAQTIARLEHPHIVPLYDYWRDPEGAYLVMRYLKGGNLLAALEKGPWDVQPTADLLDQIAAALAVAHQQGIVHRDIKPANILLDQSGNAYLSDFGIAKDLVGEMQLTADGAVIGTLDYISPEQIQSQSVTPQTDIYSLGAVLYETLTGEKPFPDATPANLIYKHLNDPVPLVISSQPNIPRQVDAIIQRATAKNPVERYADALEMAAAFRQAVGGGIAPISTTGLEALPPAVELYNPYKGLRCFQEADAEDFFGREALVQQLLGHLTASRFLALVGPSGSGKSSAVKAGLIPALREGAIPGAENWFIAEMVPGTHPLEELEMALWPIAVDPPPSLVGPMQRDNRGLLRTIRRILPDQAAFEGGSQLLLFIDQFEELFTQVEDEARRSFFIDSLIQAIAAPRSPLRVVLTLRADFYDRPLVYETLGRLLKENTEIILPLTAEELTWAMREPARRVGVVLEEGLAEAIVADVSDQPGALPLLQFALTELFEQRHNGVMIQEAYGEIDGVLGALGRRAEAIYAGLDESGQELVRQLFLRLITLGEGVEDTRRRVLRPELESIMGQRLLRDGTTESGSAEAQAQLPLIIALFGEARLLTFDRDPGTRQPTVEVAHEALLREWGRLRGWLDESRNDVRLQRMLAEDAAEWNAFGRDAGFLLRDARLDQFAGWYETTSLALTEEEQAYLEASIAAREARLADEEERRLRELETIQKLAETERARSAENARAANRLRQRARLLAGALAVAALMAIAAFFFARQSNLNATAAQENAELADNRAAQAESEAALRATAEAVAITERESAEEQARLATSRELSAAALSNLDSDPELSVLLSIQALSLAHTQESEEALHRAVQASRVRLTLSGHEGEIWRVALSPNGEHLATASLDGTAKVWDVDSGRELFTFSNHSAEVWDVAFDPSGTRLATASADGTAKIWDAETGQELLTLSGAMDWLDAVTFSPDGNLLATAGSGEKVTLWDVSTPPQESATTERELLTLTGHTDVIWDVAFSPDGLRLATSAADQTAKVWDISSVYNTDDVATDDATGMELFALSGHTGTVSSVLFSPDGKRLATSSIDGMAIVWDADSGQPIFTLGGDQISLYRVAFSPDGQRLAAGFIDGTVTLWRLADEESETIFTLSGHDGAVNDVAFSHDGTRLITSGLDRTARIWDVSTVAGKEMLVVGEGSHDFFLRRVAVSPDGVLVATAGMFDGTARIWDAESGQELFILSEHGGAVWDVSFNPAGTLLATAGADATAKLWDVMSGELLLTMSGHEAGTAAALPAGVTEVDFSPDGKYLATAGADGTVKVWEILTAPNTGEISSRELVTLRAHMSAVKAVVFSPDGKRLATLSEDVEATAKVWDMATALETEIAPEEALLAFSGLPDPEVMFDLEFSPDGTRLVASGAGIARVWQVSSESDSGSLSGHLLFDLPGLTTIVFGVAFSPDGEHIATASQDGTARLWDANTGQPVLRLYGSPSGMSHVAFSPDGKYLVTANSDGTARQYILPIEGLMELANLRVTRSLTTEECQQYLHLANCPAKP